ncbi:hypothetical protein OJ997_24275 [Solirubrobacter phytolaccae]|uniref:Uncharacterized protein n=1 Tax=Solirubrobacter phytolaccae TaxID=1404360 RepID=A0A9X3NBM2_9ACTN|nr:hypothetical protein [Solirubrobacter phytolaccae]MDA0183448.1 hypothetical protein [Solirubrobacter phytolaccae]
MTDLPQLQTLLVDAAVKRRRHRRVRRAGVPVLVLAALVLALPWVLRDARLPDLETPAVTPGPALSVEDTFGGFRAPTERDPAALQLPDARVRTLGQPGTAYRDAYLRLRGPELCLVVVPDFFECGAASELAGGHKILAKIVGGRVYAAFPNRIQAIRRTWSGFEPAGFVVARNLVVFTAPPGAGELSWKAPDGTPVTRKLRDIRDPRLWYPRLTEPEDALDRLAGFAGARHLIADEDADVHAWLVPRKNAICLLVRVRRVENSGCRTPVEDVGSPLVVATPASPEPVVVAAFPSTLVPLEVRPGEVRDKIVDDGVLILDGESAMAIDYRYPRERGTRDVMLPYNIDGYVINGDEVRPGELKP